MYAKVENDQIVEFLKRNKGFIGTGENIDVVTEIRTRTINETDFDGNEVLWTEEEIENGLAPEGVSVGDNKTKEESYEHKTEVISQQPVKYPKSIFTLWTEEERNAIGVYSVTIDTTNKQDEAYYINTDITYAYADGAVTGSYGTPTAKLLNNILFTQADADADEIPEGKVIGDIKQHGLKEEKIRIIKQQAAGLLAPTDWHVVKASEVADYSVPATISAYRADVRAKSNEMETQINACTTVDELKALYEYTEDAEGNITRPLVSFPESPVE
jgi:hypothetical protein